MRAYLINRVLREMYPGKSCWKIYGDDYDEMRWLDETIEKPSRELIDAKIEELKITCAYETLRNERNKKLIECDYLFVSDFPHKNDESKQAWLNYRQALRDITDTQTPIYNFEEETRRLYITGVEWPTPPN